MESSENRLENMKEDLLCAICQDYFKQAITLNCTHSFCYECIKSWRRDHNECPVCRTDIESLTASLALDNLVSAYTNKEKAKTQVVNVHNDDSDDMNYDDDGENEGISNESCSDFESDQLSDSEDHEEEFFEFEENGSDNSESSFSFSTESYGDNYHNYEDSDDFYEDSEDFCDDENEDESDDSECSYDINDE